MRIYYVYLFVIFSIVNANSQTIKGTIIEAGSKMPISNATVSEKGQDNSVHSSELGDFSIEIIESYDLIIKKDGYQTLLFTPSPKANAENTINAGTVYLEKSAIFNEEDLPILILNDDPQDDSNDAGLSDNISGLFSASNDPFLAQAGYTLGSYRYRVRGLGSEESSLMMNGVPMNDLETNRIYFNIWGGLNDMFRNRTNEVGIELNQDQIGGLNGHTSYDTRASSQRVQTRASYAISNRTYRNRIMVSHATGLNTKGWGIAVSGSRRWADEGYVEGTVYDGYSYFASIDKKLNDNHLLNFTVFGTSTKRGRSSVNIQEVNDLSGSNFYNSFWGYQNGEKRNSRLQDTHLPMAILRYDWNIGKDASLLTSVSFQTGRNGQTRLNWFDSNDPRPDYYRYLPSYLERFEGAPEKAVELQAYYEDNPEALQLNWERLYDSNRNYLGTIENADGIDGNDVTGNWSRYILEEQRYDATNANFSTKYERRLNKEWTLQVGGRYRYYKSENFKIVNDLLGGDFFVDLDNFAERENSSNPEDFKQNDLNNPNRILREGDVYGWNYNLQVRKHAEWGQMAYSGKKFDFFVGGEYNNTKIFREGVFKNGRFPNNSEGESEKLDYHNYIAKGGITYKINGKNYISANALSSSMAPLARYAFTSPRTRNEVVPNLKSSKRLGGEISYNLRSPKLKARVTGYFNTIEDLTNRIGFYDDLRRTFGSIIIQDIDRKHVGIEIGGEFKVSPSWSITAVAGIGQYIVDGRQKGSIFYDNSERIGSIFLDQDFTIYSQDFFIANGPQDAYSLELSYQGKKYWFANLSLNYFDDIYTDFSPIRRTEAAVFGLNDSNLLSKVIDQTQASDQITLDFFGGKSFRFKNLFVYINIGVNNILDNQEFLTGGFEQLRYNYSSKDPDDFPNRNFYSFGRTYFISFTFKL